MNINTEKLKINLLPYTRLSEVNNLPKIPGIYFAIDAIGNVQYIGKSVNINQRWTNHHRHKQLEQLNDIKIFYLEIKKISLLEVIEKILIELYKPPLNNSKLPIKQKNQIKEKFYKKSATKEKTYKSLSFGKWLKIRRNFFGLNQKDLADELGVNQQTISNWENGISMPNKLNPDQTVKLCETLECDIYQLKRAYLGEAEISIKYS